MLGVVELGTWELGSGEFEDEVVIELRPQDASLLIVRPRRTNLEIAARYTTHKLPHRNTIDGEG